MIKINYHKVNKWPIISIILKRKKKEEIIVQITAPDKYGHHRITIQPSCAVNPPWRTYFLGVDRDYFMWKGWKETDDRLKTIKSEIFRALDIKNERYSKQATRKEYRQICSQVKLALRKLDKGNKYGC